MSSCSRRSPLLTCADGKPRKHFVTFPASARCHPAPLDLSFRLLAVQAAVLGNGYSCCRCLAANDGVSACEHAQVERAGVSCAPRKCIGWGFFPSKIDWRSRPRQSHATNQVRDLCRQSHAAMVDQSASASALLLHSGHWELITHSMLLLPLFFFPISYSASHVPSPPSTPSQQPSSMEGSFGTSKVAIPKLKRHDSNRRPSIERSSHPRISKACDSCRIRKIRCSGERPRCRNCLDQPSPCTYPLARQDRLKKSVLQTVW